MLGRERHTSSYDGVGNVTAYTDSVTGSWSVVTSGGSSGYDSLNRLVAAKATAGPYQNLQVSWSTDSFGNRKIESFSGTPTGNVPVPPSTNNSFNSKNQVQSVQSGYPPRYDAAGNVICDSYNSGTGQCMISASSNVYAYDVEGRICAVDTSSGAYGYLYDAEGARVAKGTISIVWVTVNGQQVLSCDTNSSDTTTYNHFNPTTAYVLDSGNQQMTEVASSNGGSQWTWKHTNVWAGAQLVATYSTSSGQAALNFHFTDWLGTRRVLTDSSGNTQQTCHSLPYGNGEDCTPGPIPTEHLYTQHERDSETNNDYFGARYYASSMGRYMSPDWSEDSDTVPNAEFANPQTLNLYSYGGNSPLINGDPDGHACQTSTFRTEFNGQFVTQSTITDNSTCPWFVWQPFFHSAYLLAGVYGHHFIPKGVWQDLDRASDAWKFLNKVTTGKLGPGGRVLNRFNELHRGVNKQVDELVRNLERERGKSLEDFKEGDYQELLARMQRAGGDIETFGSRMENLEPQARTLTEAFEQAYEEVFGAALNAAEATAPAAEDAAAGAAALE